jgi:hypothetical protein
MRRLWAIWHWFNPQKCLARGGSFDTADYKMIDQDQAGEVATIECKCGVRIQAVKSK